MTAYNPPLTLSQLTDKEYLYWINRLADFIYDIAVELEVTDCEARGLLREWMRDR